MKAHLAALSITVLVFVVSPHTAESCTCVVSPDRCASVGKADVVFEGTVEAIQSGLPPAGIFADGPFSTVTLRDVTSLKGEAQPIVITPTYSTACGYQFNAGKRYLVVASRTDDGRLEVTQCGLTQLLEGAEGLADYVRTLAGPSNQTRVWGHVEYVRRWIDPSPEIAPVGSARVTFTGPERRTVTTSADGSFLVTGLRQGRYMARVELPPSLEGVDGVEPYEFSLFDGESHACTAMDLVAPGNGRISGLIRDETGMPVRGAFVEIGLQAEHSIGPADRGTRTNALGQFTLDHLPAGSYIVGLNVWEGYPSDEFAVAYARTVSGDTAISLPPGGKLTLAPLQARRLVSIQVQGTVRTSDGKPVQGVKVVPWMFGEGGRHPVPPAGFTDAAGRFTLRLWKGERYYVVVGEDYNPDATLEMLASETPMVFTVRPH